MQGFGVPVYEWFSDKLGDEMNATLRTFCKEADFLDLREVEKMIAQGNGTQLWFLFNFAMWWNRYIR